MLEADVKELLKGKTMDELLNLIILGLKHTDKNDKPLMETA